MKSSRQEQILKIIAERDIETQFQLAEVLKARKIEGTQATISRDIKELRLVKELTAGGKYRYALPSGTGAANFDTKLKKIFKESVTSCETAGNLIVIKTLPGLASAACSTLDGMNISNLAGTLAGDDTAFIAMRDNDSAENLCNDIKSML
ncbi:MAG: arginine repressor [Oscillospiraceae bacterium]|nr:arginine repressor [Oscillospiraceae bacterium]